MNKWIALLLACLALGLVVAGCGDDDDDGGDGAAPTEQPAEEGGGGAATEEEPAGGGAAAVSLVNIQFDPSELEVKAGDTITFTNDEAVPHDVHKTAGPGADFSSGETGGMQEGDTFKLTLDEPGKYEYVCNVHAPGMAGTITVEIARGLAPRTPAGDWQAVGWSARPAPEPEAAQQQQRRLPQPAAGRQEPELCGSVVEVEESARAAHCPVRQLDHVHAVERHEALARRQHRAEVTAVAAERPPGHARLGAAHEWRRRGLDPQVGERRAQAGGVAIESVDPAEGIHGHRVLVGDVRRAAGLEASTLPRRSPALGQLVDGGSLELRAHGPSGLSSSSARPSSGEEARACSRRGIRPAMRAS